MPHTPVITVRNANVTYFMGKRNEVRALQHVDLDVHEGEFVVFFGPSGCGKSTLLYTIAGLERPIQGDIYVGGQHLGNMSSRELESHHQKTVGFIFQAFHLIPSLTVMQNVELPVIAIGGSVRERRTRAEELLGYFGVVDQTHKFPGELSGGQQQRVAICRALMNNPDIILADEPVGNLDSQASWDVLRLIQDINIKEKKTIVLVTHDPTHLDIAHRVFYMKDGRVTDIRVNEQLKRIADKKRDTKSSSRQGKIEPYKSNLELLSEMYSSLGDQHTGALILEYKAKQVVTEALTGLTIEQMNRIEWLVKQMFIEGIKDTESLLLYLKSEEFIGMDKATAERLAKNIIRIVEEMRRLEKPDKRDGNPLDEKVKDLRYYLLDTFDVRVRTNASIESIERVVRDRLQGLIDQKEVRSRLCASINEGGAGLSRSDAKRMARRLDLILLGGYTSAQSESSQSTWSSFRQTVFRAKKIPVLSRDIPHSSPKPQEWVGNFTKILLTDVKKKR